MGLLSFDTQLNDFNTAEHRLEQQIRGAYMVNIHHSCCALWSTIGFDLDAFVRKTTNIVGVGNALFFSNRRPNLIHFGIKELVFDVENKTCCFHLEGGCITDNYKFFVEDNCVFIHHFNWKIYSWS